METKGKSLFWCVTSESQPGHVNTLWVGQKCYRADETRSMYSMISHCTFSWACLTCSLISVHVRVIFTFLFFGFCLVLFSGKVGLVVFCPLSLEDKRAFLHSTLCMVLGYSSRRGVHAECFPPPPSALQWGGHNLGTALQSLGKLGSCCWHESVMQQPGFPGFSPPCKTFPLAARVLPHFVWESREAGALLPGGCLYRLFSKASHALQSAQALCSPTLPALQFLAFWPVLMELPPSCRNQDKWGTTFPAAANSSLVMDRKDTVFSAATKTLGKSRKNTAAVVMWIKCYSQLQCWVCGADWLWQILYGSSQQGVLSEKQICHWCFPHPFLFNRAWIMVRKKEASVHGIKRLTRVGFAF